MSEITDWQTLREITADGAAEVLDLRPAVVFAAGHWPGSLNAPVPDPLPGRLPDDLLPTHLLPPRHAALLLIGCERDALERVRGWLRARGRPEVRVAAVAADAAPAPELERGDGAARLWRPPPWLEEHAALLPDPELGPAVDLGCGNGRAAAWLAARGYAVTAADRHAEALDRTRELADATAGRVTPLLADLTDSAQWPEGPWGLAVALRFLHRPLLADLERAVVQGGVAVVRTFLWREGPWTLPRRRFCLEPGELTTLFAPSAWETLALREDDDDDGRPAAGIVARRR